MGSIEITPEVAAERVARGVNFLNDYYSGTQWMYYINWEWFQFTDPSRCILGQLFEHYNTAVESFQFTYQEVCNLGFDIFVEDAGTGAHKLLHDAWLTYRPINARN